ncbi:hypothetical protein RISK_000469 [Rhodopirellula islandica]|uniref:Uncharacterized protein n=1 Tax=Rhodopirellula islandica TaxID=595434 RepID=A0A0J1BLL4_RHOIS|nr:hypothetical protein [Rhodopirellula islandica]KLU07391.1 hypothetical protein RISK_000469 [Rhodopirellula islandica]
MIIVKLDGISVTGDGNFADGVCNASRAIPIGLSPRTQSIPSIVGFNVIPPVVNQ